MQIGFAVAQPQSSVVTAQVTRSLASANPTSPFRNVQVSISGQTAVLRGSVASTDDRDLAEQIALLEPSVSSVRNELSVQTPAAETPQSPAPQP